MTRNSRDYGKTPSYGEGGFIKDFIKPFTNWGGTANYDAKMKTWEATQKKIRGMQAKDAEDISRAVRPDLPSETDTPGDTQEDDGTEQ